MIESYWFLQSKEKRLGWSSPSIKVCVPYFFYFNYIIIICNESKMFPPILRTKKNILFHFHCRRLQMLQKILISIKKFLHWISKERLRELQGISEKCTGSPSSSGAANILKYLIYPKVASKAVSSVYLSIELTKRIIHIMFEFYNKYIFL